MGAKTCGDRLRMTDNLGGVLILIHIVYSFNFGRVWVYDYVCVGGGGGYYCLIQGTFV